MTPYKGFGRLLIGSFGMHDEEASTSFVLRTTVLNNLAVQAVIASIFQLQTILVNSFVDEIDRGHKIESIIFFFPLLGLCIICLIVAHVISHPKDPVFGWLAPVTLSPFLKGAVSFMEYLGASTAANAGFFVRFQSFRTESL